MFWNMELLREMDRLRKEVDTLFSNYRQSSASITYPLVNVYDSKDEVTVTAELPGLTKDRVNITFADGVLTLSGKLEPLTGAAKMTSVRQERSVGAFEKNIRIPVKVEQNKINASFSNGILTIYMPKSEEAKPKAITIE